ncbi:MAG: hypothetical protein COB26_02195 [Piscirickettsiaceae bacterium]|nr:MAG: hypothetical protein COB89_06610 [Piscirickettsiaceae bacterium]PCI70896.1 MAG: hypothetical protein COB26_02195 [Piscirickettsiaceae bacterium]
MSTIAGALSVGLAVLVGFLMSIKTNNSGYDIRDSALAGLQQEAFLFGFVKRVTMGLVGFTVVAILTGWLSGYLQGYPYFLLIGKWPF